MNHKYINKGDELVFKCPTWSWECASEPSKVRSILPPDKQFLITRNVPCSERIQTMRNKIGEMTELLEGTQLQSDDPQSTTTNDNDEGWLISHINTKPRNDEDDNDDEELDEFEVLNTNEEEEEITTVTKLMSYSNTQDQLSTTSNTSPTATNYKQSQQQQRQEEDNEDEYGDLEDDTMEQDETTATTNSIKPTTKNSNIQRVRTYDISITYDKYYQTPKVWILGYTSGGTPLSTEQMFQDIMPEYVQRTVTIEAHPSLGTTQLSIHPCQHAAVMKTILRNLNQSPKVEFYLFIFLKFISSIIPTINYDFTLDVTTTASSSSITTSTSSNIKEHH
jgi:ubiquitin-like-conjugating enzyme ATG3